MLTPVVSKPSHNDNESDWLMHSIVVVLGGLCMWFLTRSLVVRELIRMKSMHLCLSVVFWLQQQQRRDTIPTFCFSLSLCFLFFLFDHLCFASFVHFLPALLLLSMFVQLLWNVSRSVSDDEWYSHSSNDCGHDSCLDGNRISALCLGLFSSCCFCGCRNCHNWYRIDVDYSGRYRLWLGCALSYHHRWENAFLHAPAQEELDRHRGCQRKTTSQR